MKTDTQLTREAFQQRAILITLLVAAFVARLGVRLAFGEEYFWSNSYYFYYALAENIASGHGLCSQTRCVFKPPIYPLFLASTALIGKNYLLIVVPSAMIGAGTALCAFLIGRQIFNQRVGLLACGITAFYPYCVMHDTALQETGMVTFFMALSIMLLLRANRLNRKSDWFLAGLVLGATVLVRISMLPGVGLAVIWTAVARRDRSGWERLRSSAILLLTVSVILGPWLLRSYHFTGSLIFSSDTGYVLWQGNNPDTFSHYPDGSIDQSARVGFSHFTETDRDELKRLRGNEIATSRWFADRALGWMQENPRLVFTGAIRKIEAVFSWRLNPLRETLAQTVYAISYVPVAVFGIVGMALAWRRPEVLLIVMQYLSFIAVTAVFFGHTSHRSYLDVYWIVFAASALEIIRTRLMNAHVKRKVASA